MTHANVEHALFNFMLGANSAIGTEIRRTTNIDGALYCKFIYTFILSCQTRHGVIALHRNEDMSKEYVLAAKEYNQPYLANDISSGRSGRRGWQSRRSNLEAHRKDL